jgi:DNA-binding transcriptional LysR family regulator
LKRADLNLLNVFYAIMVERSVTRAAQRLAMTQPAVSNALRRLRHLLQDELFIKTPGGIRPTEKALEIWPTVEEALDKILEVTQPLTFRPADTRLTFNIAVTDTLVSRVVPVLATRLAEEAPNSRTNFHPHSDPASTAGLERGVLDCAVGMFPNPPPYLQREGLFSDDYVCVFRRGHPRLSARLSLDQLVDAKHLLVKQSTTQIGIVDAWLNLQGRKRDIVMVVNSAAEAISVICRTDLTTMAPHSYVMQVAHDFPLEVAPLPFEHPRILYKLAWHERTERDPARRWLRTVIRDVVRATCMPTERVVAATG